MDGGEPVLLGRFVEYAHEHLLPGSDVGVVLRILGSQVAVGPFLLPAAGDAGGGPVGNPDPPEVVPVVQDDLRVLLRPEGETVGLGHHRVVVFLVPEDRVDAAGQVPDLLRRHVIDEPCALVVIPPDGVFSLGGELHRFVGAAGDFLPPAGAGEDEGKHGFSLRIPLAFNSIDWTHFQNHFSIVVVSENEPVRLVGIEGDEAFVLVQARESALLVAGQVRLHPRGDLVGIPRPDVQARRLEGDEVGVLDGNVFLDARIDAPVLLAEAIGTVLRQAPVLGHVAALVGGHELPRLVPDDVVQPQGGVLAAGGRRVLRLQVEGLGPFLVKDRHRMEGGGVREHPSLAVGIETDDRVLLVRLLDQAERAPVLREGELVDAAQGVQASIGKMIDRDRRSLVLVLLFHESGVDGGKGELVGGMESQLERLDVRELADATVPEVDDGQGILRQFVARQLLDLRPARLLELGLDEAEGVGVIVQDPRLVAAGDFDDAGGAFLSGDAEIERAVAFLRVDGVGNDFPGRGEDGSTHGLPAVVDVMVERFLLGPERSGEGGKGGEEENSFHIRVVV